MLQFPDKPLSVIKSFLHENGMLVYRYMVLSVSSAIKNNDRQAELFSFGSTNNNIAIIKQTDYEKVLTDAITYFTKTEEYELAAFARDVLSKWKIEQITNNKYKE